MTTPGLNGNIGIWGVVVVVTGLKVKVGAGWKFNIGTPVLLELVVVVVDTVFDGFCELLLVVNDVTFGDENELFCEKVVVVGKAVGACDELNVVPVVG